MKNLTKELFYISDVIITCTDVIILANELLNTNWVFKTYFNDNNNYNLKQLGWKFEFNNRKNAAGLCSIRNKTIYISSWILNQNLNKSMFFENTLRHEIAHALDYEIYGKCGHGNTWKRIAKTILNDAERCFSNNKISFTETTKYTLTCINCNNTFPSHKSKRAKSACGECCNTYNYGKYSDKYLLVQTQNY